MGERREQRGGHSEEHRVDVDDVGAEQDPLREGEPEPLADRLQARRDSALGRGHRPHRRKRREADDERREIDGERQLGAGHGEQHSAERRSGDARKVHPAPPQRRRRR